MEAVSQTYALGSTASADLGGSATAKRVWARTVNLKAGIDIDLSLDNPAGADFDLYLYSMTPSETGTPVILASSTAANAGDDEALQYTPTADMKALLVVKRVSGAGPSRCDRSRPARRSPATFRPTAASTRLRPSRSRPRTTAGRIRPAP